MSLTVTYLDDLSRVRLEITGVPDGTVTVERSLNQVDWVPVRGGTSLPIQGGEGVLDDYEFAPDQVNYYRVSLQEPPPGLFLPGDAGDYASTPDVPALTIPGNIDVRVEATHDTWDPATEQTFVAQYADSTNQRSWRFSLDAGGNLRFTWSPDGTAFVNHFSEFPMTDIIDSGRRAIRVTAVNNTGSGDYTVTFYTADTIAGPWFQFGSSFTLAGSIALFDSTADLEVGSRNGGGTTNYNGVIHAVQVRNGVEGVDITGMQLPGAVGDYASTPDDPSLDIPDRMDIQLGVQPETWLPSTTTGLARKYSITGNQRSWALWVNSSGSLVFRFSQDGTAFTTATSTVAIPTTAGAVRVTFVNNNGSNFVISMFTADSIDGPWTQLGSLLGGTPITGIFAGTADLEVGRITDNVDGITSDPLTGLVHEFRVWDGIEGEDRRGLLLDGSAGSYASAPDAPGLDITGDLEIAAFIEPTAWSGTTQSIITKYDTAGNQRSYQLVLSAGGNLQLNWSEDGVSSVSGGLSTVPVSTPPGQIGVAVRVTLDVDDGGGNRVVTFYTSDSVNGPWTQLGSPVVTAGTTSVFSGTAPMEVGSRATGATNLFTGLVRSVIVRNGIGGTIVAAPVFEDQAAGTPSFSDGPGNTWTVNGTATIIDESAAIVAGPDFDAQAPGTTNFVDAYGKTWTVNGNAAIVDVTGGTVVADPDFEAQPAGTLSFTDDAGRLWTINGNAFILADPLEEGQILPAVGVPWLKSVEFPFLNRPLDCTNYGTVSRDSRSGVFAVKGRSFPVSVEDVRGSREFEITVATNGPDNTDRLEMLLVGGGVLFLSVPPEFDMGCGRLLQIPSGYFSAGNVSFERLVPGSRVTSWEIDLVQVAAPHLESITPTTMIWTTVLNLYDSWNELLAEHATWRGLLEQIAPPEDAEVQ